MNVQRLAAFSEGDIGGNPAGVMIAEELPSAEEMQAIAAQVGFSETAFAQKQDGDWRVRYFSPQSEVPFCGHATIALGAALAREHGDAAFTLILNEATITVEGKQSGDVIEAALQSPPTFSKPIDTDLLEQTLALFGLSETDLDPALPPAFAHAGANHLILPLRDRSVLASMDYNLNTGKAMMDANGVVTIMLVVQRETRTFDSRNAFASGGVFEDPATGAASAAFGGYLRDIDWPHAGSIAITQGEDMGMTSRINVEIPPEKGSSIRVSGTARIMA